MGPSGGGKTSLLNALAGQVPETKGKTPNYVLPTGSLPCPCQYQVYNVWLLADTAVCYAGMQLQGNVRVNGQPRGRAAYKQAYVQQEDMFYAQLTVRWAELNCLSALEPASSTTS